MGRPRFARYYSPRIFAPKRGVRCYLKMGFERFQNHQHVVADNVIDVSYDRFTTKFEIKVNDVVAYTERFWLWPSHKAVIKLDSRPYLLSVYWFLLWGAKLKKDGEIVVGELLPKRRRSSIILLGYGVFIILVRATLVVWAP